VSLSSALAPARLALRQLTTNILRATDGRDVLLNSPNGWEVEQPWLWWTGPGNGTVGPFGHPIPGSSGYGFGAIPGVSRATELIVDMIAALPWHVYRDDTERLRTPDWIEDPQALRLDGRIVDTAAVAETRLSSVDFWAQWLLSALWYGDGFLYVPARDEAGAPKPPLWVLHPHDVELRDGRYWVSDIELAPSTVIHLRGKTPIVDGRGTGVLDRFAADLDLAVSLRDYVNGAFTAGVPAGYLKANVPNLSQEQADTLKSRWLSQHSGIKRSIAVLNATTEFHALTWSPVDLAAVDFSRITLSQIALMFGVPAYLLNVPSDSSTYANVENRMRELYQTTWYPWIKKIEAVITAQLARGTKLRVELDGILRADFKTRMEGYKIAIDTGILTVDEARALENRPPTEEVAVA
jgi:HK97 family phage portal protein